MVIIASRNQIHPSKPFREPLLSYSYVRDLDSECVCMYECVGMCIQNAKSDFFSDLKRNLFMCLCNCINLSIQTTRCSLFMCCHTRQIQHFSLFDSLLIWRNLSKEHIFIEIGSSTSLDF